MKKGYLYIILATFFFSSMEIALKISAGSYNPIQLTFLRFLIGALVLLPLAIREIRKRQISFHIRDWKFFSLTGFICVFVSMILYQLGIVYAKASVVAVLFSCNSVFVVLFAYLLLAEKIYRHTILSILVSVAGMLVIINPAHLSGNAAGIVFSIGAAITFALYNVIGRTKSDRYGGITLTCFSFLFGCAEMLLFIAVTHLSAVANWFTGAGFPMFVNVPVLSGIQLSSIPGLIYVGIFVTGLGYTFYFRAMEETSAATASLVFYIKPVLAPIFAFFVLNEPITLQMAIGILLIIIGSFISFIPGIRLQKANGERKSLSEDMKEIESEFEAETDETVIKP
ncbi:DMT family transporter [Caproiciproducens galactitolivorans]|uniref:DMT family transporter n=1 Tax=Caproiciproducens galactitolivorans TaxID=642589 RepID=A0ABT4BPB7_9FIRM|nr:DMT family transporter [Caproiciproducens galactitolivorans]MCY1712716.1 DMT family transporter [Caproiciproducens galactitolivorans]